MTVIKLGGCNGSGKTSVARALMKHVGGVKEEPYTLASGKQSKIYRARYSNVSLVILGKYESACGGMDTISDKFDRYDMVEDWATTRPKTHIVFFEGLITGKTYGALGELCEQHAARKPPIPWLWAFMDTPFDVCVARVMQRRHERRERDGLLHTEDEFDPERTMRSTFNSCMRLADKLRDGTLPPHPVYMINHKQKPETAAKNLLNRALELHHAR
jgi:thymidylate kinase